MSDLTKKFLLLLGFVILTPTLAAIYGILHDQLTYTVSPEYYTTFKFLQFGIADWAMESQRLGAVVVGIGATWWVGLPLGLILGGVAMIHPTPRRMWRKGLQAIAINLLVALLMGLAALVLALYVIDLPNLGGHYHLLQDPHAFYAVGMMHNFSYLGGVVGLIVAVIWQVVINLRYRKKQDVAG